MSPADRGPGRTGEPSSSRRRFDGELWPEPFLEAVAVKVAVDAAATSGKLSAAPAIVALFQVCSSWRTISQSELLWQTLTRGVWFRERRHRPTWRAEFAHCHRIGSNFRRRHCAHSVLLKDPSLACRRLALSDSHLGAGFLDGSVRIFDLASSEHVTTFIPNPARDVLGSFSRSISGLIFDRPGRLIYASQDGDIHVASLRPGSKPPRRVRTGNPVEDGTLVDFAGQGGWWVGLFAGVPGRSLRVWHGGEGELAFVGGSLTDPDAVVGWHMFTDQAGAVGRVRFSDPGTVVGCTASRMFVVALDRPEGTLAELGFRRAAAVEAVDACEDRVMVVDEDGQAKVTMARTLEEVCQFDTGRRETPEPGAMNWGYAIVCGGDGSIGVWDAITGEFLYTFRERVNGTAAAVVADDQRVAVWCEETGLHLWDFDHSYSESCNSV